MRDEDIEERISEALRSESADGERRVSYFTLSLLEREAADDPALSRTLSEAFARKAVQIEQLLHQQSFEIDRVACATLAARAVRVAPVIEDRRALIEALGPDGAAGLMRALALDITDLACIAHGSSTWRDEREAASRLLLDAAERGGTAAAQAVEEAVFTALAFRPEVTFGWIDRD